MPTESFTSTTLKKETYSKLEEYCKANGLRPTQLITEIANRLDPSVSFIQLMKGIEFATSLQVKQAIDKYATIEKLGFFYLKVAELSVRLHNVTTKTHEDKLAGKIRFVLLDMIPVVDEILRVISRTFQETSALDYSAAERQLRYSLSEKSSDWLADYEKFGHLGFPLIIELSNSASKAYQTNEIFKHPILEKSFTSLGILTGKLSSEVQAYQEDLEARRKVQKRKS